MTATDGLSGIRGEDQPTLRIDVVSDVVCPWCYIGKRNLEASLRQLDRDVAVHWRPYQLDPSIPPEGHDRQVYMRRKFGDRVPEIQARITQAAEAAGLHLDFDRIHRSPNTLDAHRVIRWAWSAGVQDAVVESLFRAFFVEGRDIGDRSVLVEHAVDAGMDGSVVARLLDEDTDAAAVHTDVEQARSLGVTGVPFFILDGRIGIAGAQPPEALSRALAKAAEPSMGAS